MFCKFMISKVGRRYEHLIDRGIIFKNNTSVYMIFF